MCKWEIGTKQHAVEELNKFLELQRKREKTLPKKVICYTDSKIYNSIKEFEREHNLKHSKGWKILAGIQSNTTGLRFELIEEREVSIMRVVLWIKRVFNKIKGVAVDK
ncbi:MAG: hypothetical protein ACRC7W_01085 [Fusobacteriaceae bacterium]